MHRGHLWYRTNWTLYKWLSLIRICELASSVWSVVSTTLQCRVNAAETLNSNHVSLVHNHCSELHICSVISRKASSYGGVKTFRKKFITWNFKFQILFNRNWTSRSQQTHSPGSKCTIMHLWLLGFGHHAGAPENFLNLTRIELIEVHNVFWQVVDSLFSSCTQSCKVFEMQVF